MCVCINGFTKHYRAAEFANFVLRAEIATRPKMVAISARNIKVYKICKLCKAIFSAFYNISKPIKLCNFTHFSTLFLAEVIYLHFLA